jgi:hypothetical protein
MAAHGQETAHHAAAGDGDGGGGFAESAIEAFTAPVMEAVDHLLAEDMASLPTKDGLQTLEDVFIPMTVGGSTPNKGGGSGGGGHAPVKH